MKKLLSIILSITITISSVLFIGSGTSYAKSYADTLRDKGFTESYIDDLVKLHAIHPKWIFEPLITNIDWQTAVNGERSRHSNQLIEKYSGNSSSMYCYCSGCTYNGEPIIREGRNWVAASEEAVKYYMDPRNFLDEKHIFQFESVSYDGTQSKKGVNAILSGTWMHESLIKYKTTSGSSKQYDDTTTYADAIMKAASNSGMSAYYLAAKIRQENGGQNPTATAVCGTCAPFQGIYNYYNIGAYSGAVDGLEWAAGYIKTTKETYLYESYSSKDKKVFGKKQKVASGQYMTWRANAGDYYYVRLYDSSFKEGASGYIPISACRTTYLGDTPSGYGRPWTNPYKTIYYGAEWIYNSFKYQNTGYLQKFNVSPSAPYLYTNEYMRNVSGAASEAVSTYNGYKNADILEITKKFIIPVFKNMPNDIGKKELSCTARTNSSVTLKWDTLDTATRYDVQQFKNEKWETILKTDGVKSKIEELKSGVAYKFRIAYYSEKSKKYLGYSKELSVATKVGKINNLRASVKGSAITLTWDKKDTADGYYIYLYSASSKAYKKYATVSDGKQCTIRLDMPKDNQKYKLCVSGYKNTENGAYGGYQSSPVTARTQDTRVVIKSIKSPKQKRIKVKWNKIYKADGYEVMWSTYKDFSENFLSVYAESPKERSKTITTYRSDSDYYVRVRAYRLVNGSKEYYKWSKASKIHVAG